MPRPVDLVDLGHGRGQAREQLARSVWRIDAALGVLPIQSAYRDWDEQMRLYLAYKRDPKNNPLAVHPEYSWHCQGMAIDTSFRPTARLHDYGFRFEVASEAWHGQYYARLDKYYGQPSGGGGNEWSDDVLNTDDKAWLRLMVRQEIEQRLKDGPNLALNDKEWSRLMVQQELAADE